MPHPTDPPALILLTCLRTAGLVNAAGSQTWPGTFADMADQPANFLTVYDTTPDAKDRLMNATQVQYYGNQIRVRGGTYVDAYQKIVAVKNYLLTQVGKGRQPTIVTVSGRTYKIQAFHQTMDIVQIIKEEKNIAPVLTYNGTFTITEG